MQDFSKIIKKLRKDSNLTQNELAEKLGVTYQAVSKWETGKNMPDISILRLISKEFNVNLDYLIDGKNTNKNKVFKLIIVLVILIILGSLLFHYFINGFEFKTLNSKCSVFNIQGSISYDQKKSSIYISNIEYCDEDNNEYINISCELLEKSDNLTNKISEYNYNDLQSITIKEFLSKVSFAVDNYIPVCKNYKNSSLQLLIKATDKNNKVITYEVPIEFEDCD